MTMSDRIAVMNDGKVEQVGTPNNLYYEPRNRFVATFIGNPNMNFAPGAISKINEGEVQIEIGDFDVKVNVESSEQVVAKQEITVGFRPECINIGERVEKTHFESEVTLVEQIGDQLMVTMAGPFGEEIRGITPAGNRPEVDEVVPISLDLGRLHLFDPETDEAITNTK
jgi:ABC-type sugar transport system ATPase subunit